MPIGIAAGTAINILFRILHGAFGHGVVVYVVQLLLCDFGRKTFDGVVVLSPELVSAVVGVVTACITEHR